MSPSETVVERGAAPRRLKKAEGFLAAAAGSLASSHWDAAVSNAVLAGIAASDAYMIWVHRRQATGRDHREAIKMLRMHGGPAVKEQAVALERLVGRKSEAQYGDRLSTEREARDAVVRADRLVSWAKQTLKGAK